MRALNASKHTLCRKDLRINNVHHRKATHVVNSTGSKVLTSLVAVLISSTASINPGLAEELPNYKGVQIFNVSMEQDKDSRTVSESEARRAELMKSLNAKKGKSYEEMTKKKYTMRDMNSCPGGDCGN
ncbi:hypothetical protein CEUSTIGMA_g4708.t1 [Chlamydomonas eustigma]|uniref:Uncharacterized protein n=1 Tax=Chlamydomonas eustigma TaxID=1157962 RepID=A0A250X2Y7_9CHLO|nr:hypothetical protein CEUSTIGMA_g4708.t1 [Chlamydomonas eustigma]|eukprot:GAX77262.1 hypothetical protein CEUSTIGMA_g4708.t1 [Chlamydomonas eustigma]